MPHYVDGFVLPVPKDKIEAYRKLAQDASVVWKEYGAIAYFEGLADDVQPGKLTSFPQAVQLKDDEVVVFSWIVYRSREHRDEVNAKVMADPRIANIDPATMPFDSQRMFWGGFSSLVEA
ncbi:DUF1428 domain-containing protein [Rhizobacter sp. J219]|uniref:DUF1428 domain-containing protein n=1 Tax=Rhizobacter sp. J219 TaxID=2898430 RepID=UPI002151A045|nr:DUF1428 domain-containing protein [Rhizobacter sp. J219]MCR5884775.1 DUF1428 domain-containing protein [Rhizobacter sp. J219]